MNKEQGVKKLLEKYADRETHNGDYKLVFSKIVWDNMWKSINFSKIII